MLIKNIEQLEGDELDDFLEEYYEDDPDTNPLNNSFIGAKDRIDMTEKEQMLFVIDNLEKYIDYLESSSGFYVDHLDEIERQNKNMNYTFKTTGNKYKQKLAYVVFGEYRNWEFE
jgi:hypothetical protein